MSKYIFLTKNYSEGPTRYFAISPERIETLNLFETYDKFGQEVGHYDAGDYHFGNGDSTAIKDCNWALVKAGLLKNSDEIQYVENGELFQVDDLYGENENCDKDAIQSFVNEWRENEEILSVVEGFNFWDGHNWQTVVTSCEYAEPNYLILDDEVLTERLNEAIENSSFERKEVGANIYSYEGWEIIESFWHGTWHAYEITEKTEY